MYFLSETSQSRIFLLLPHSYQLTWRVFQIKNLRNKENKVCVSLQKVKLGCNKKNRVKIKYKRVECLAKLNSSLKFSRRYHQPWTISSSGNKKDTLTFGPECDPVSGVQVSFSLGKETSIISLVWTEGVFIRLTVPTATSPTFHLDNGEVNHLHYHLTDRSPSSHASRSWRKRS